MSIARVHRLALREGLRIAEALGDRRDGGAVPAWLAVLATNRLRFADALGHGRRAVVAGRVAGDDAALAAALDGLKNAYAYLGELGRSVRCSTSWSRWCAGSATWSCCSGRCSNRPSPRSRPPTGPRRSAGSARRSRSADRSGYALHDGVVPRPPGLGGAATGPLRQSALGHCRGPWAAARDRPPMVRHQRRVELGKTLVELGRTAEAVELLTGGGTAANRDGAEAYLLRCLAPLAEATGSTEILVDADALLGVICGAGRVGVAAGQRCLPGGRPCLAAQWGAGPGPRPCSPRCSPPRIGSGGCPPSRACRLVDGVPPRLGDTTRRGLRWSGRCGSRASRPARVERDALAALDALA